MHDHNQGADGKGHRDEEMGHVKIKLGWLDPKEVAKSKEGLHKKFKEKLSTEGTVEFSVEFEPEAEVPITDMPVNPYLAEPYLAEPEPAIKS